MPLLKVMPKPVLDNTETVEYGYRTSRGSIAMLFSNQKRAEEWFAGRQDKQPTFAATLTAVRVTTTVKIEEIEYV